MAHGKCLPRMFEAKLWDTIKQSLTDYRCQHSEAKDGEHMPLVDMLTPQGDGAIVRGESELKLLADAVYSDTVELLRKACTVGHVAEQARADERARVVVVIETMKDSAAVWRDRHGPETKEGHAFEYQRLGYEVLADFLRQHLGGEG